MDTETRIKALAKFLACEPGEITEARYRENTFEFDREEYLVLTDSEADTATRATIEDSLWAFRASFIAAHANADLDDAAIKALEKMQGELCESAGPLVRALIKDFDHFVQDAIRADGRGHFLSGYDGEENEIK